MTHWMCANCGYYLQADTPPDRCPGCNQVCAFNDVTCYRPECGGEKNVDPLLVGSALRSVRVPQKQAEPSTAPPLEAFPAVQLFAGLTAQQKERVTSLGRTETYKAGEVICTEGTESENLYLVKEGQVAVGSVIGGKMHIPISIVSEGEAFSWSALVPPYRLTATVVATAKTQVLAIKRGALLQLISAEPELGLIMMQNVASIIASRLRSLGLELAGLIQGQR